MKKLFLVSCIATALSVPVFAVTPEEALASRFRAAEALIDANLTRESVPGAAIGIVHDQALIWSHQFGVESFITNKPVSDDTLFSVCSVSKLFNGVAAMNLVDEGRLELDAPLSQYNSALAMPDNIGSEEPVTVRGILTHAAGLPREGTRDYWANTSFPETSELLDMVSMHESLYRPYDYWQYSNLGMSMLGDVISKVSDMSWGDYVEQNIFTPLGMTNSQTDMPFDIVGNGFAQGYYVRNPKGERNPVKPHSFKSFAPAAGVASSVNDMAKFASWHFRLHEKGGEEVLKATTLRNMQRVHWVGADFNEPAWGLAYATRRYDGKTMWGHGGYCPGARTEFVMRLPTKVGIVMMMSVNDVSPGAMVETVYSLTADAITNVHANQEESKSPHSNNDNKALNLSAYEGTYYVPNYDSDSYIGVNEDGLFSMPIFSSDPAGSVETWIHEEEDTFRRKRDDGTLAEPITFERSADGKVTGVVQHGYRSLKR